MTGFEPLHNAHAIDQVVFAVQLSGLLDDSTFEQVTSSLDPITQELPGKELFMRANLTVSLGNVPAPQLAGMSGRSLPTVPFGKTYRAVEPDGTIGTEFTVDRGSMMFRTARYTRWAETWARGKKYFDAIFPVYLGKASPSAISLNYLDKFVWHGNESECRPSELLRSSSIYLCPHVYQTEELWHSHTGAFSKVDANTKRLLNVNVDFIDEKTHDRNRRVVSIGTVLTDFLNQPGFEELKLLPDAGNAYLDSKMQELHLFGKEAFSAIVGETMSKRIALNGP